MKTSSKLLNALGKGFDKARLATLSTEELEKELIGRRMEMQFPLDVFHPYLRNTIQEYVSVLKVEPSFVGMTILNTSGALIGKTICLKNGMYTTFPKLWTVLIGKTSAYKSQVINHWTKPLKDIHLELSEQYEIELNKFFDAEQEARKTKSEFNDIYPIEPSIYEQDVFMPTLKRKVLKNNPRGFMMCYDEMKTWVTSLDGKKGSESSDEAEYLSLYNDTGLFLVQRGGERVRQEKIVNPFMCLLGGTQPAYSYHYFHRERDVSGFASRFMFGVDVSTKLVARDSQAEVDMSRWDQVCRVLYGKMHYSQTPDEVRFSAGSWEVIKNWETKIINEINAIEDKSLNQLNENWFGKAKIHVARIALILFVIDCAAEVLEKQKIKTDEDLQTFLKGSIRLDAWGEINATIVEQAIKVVEYSRHSMRYVFDCWIDQQNLKQIPQSVRRLVLLINSGMNLKEIHRIVANEGYKESYVTFTRYISDLKIAHPNLFN